jgi:hypothetical protein
LGIVEEKKKEQEGWRRRRGFIYLSRRGTSE